MIEKIRKYLIENIAYVVVFTFTATYLVIKEGTNYTMNYLSILLALFVPIFLVINLYSLFKAFILKEKIDYKELLVCILLAIVLVIVYLFGLKEIQRIVLGLINGATSLVIVFVMLFITNRK